MITKVYLYCAHRMVVLISYFWQWLMTIYSQLFLVSYLTCPYTRRHVLISISISKRCLHSLVSQCFQTYGEIGTRNWVMIFRRFEFLIFQSFRNMNKLIQLQTLFLFTSESYSTISSTFFESISSIVFNTLTRLL